MLTTVDRLQTALYLRLGELMPADAPDEWFLQPDPFFATPPDRMRLGRFIVEVENMLWELLDLSRDATASDYMSVVYDAARRTFDDDSTQLRTFFMWLYAVLFHSANGPRWGDFIAIYGVDAFVLLVQERFHTL